MASALAADFLLCYLHTAAVADDAFVADALVLSAVALIIFRRTEDALTKQTVTLWFIGAVVDGFRLQYLTVGVLKDFLWRCQTDGNLGETGFLFVFFLKCHLIYCYGERVIF